MASAPSAAALKHLQTLFRVGVLGGVTDGQLLERFVRGDEHSAEAAFEALVERHGGMVLRICHHMLGDPHDAEDASQATFMILARRAGAIRKRDSVGSWLFGVAYRVSARSRVATARRKRLEREGAELAADSVVERNQTGSWTDLYEELDRLHEPFRAPIVLCYLEGQTNEQAAQQLQWPLRTLQRRLEQGRERLKGRLIRRGVTLSAVLAVGAELALERAKAAAPAAWTKSTVSAALRVASGKSAVGAGLSTSVIAMSSGQLGTGGLAWGIGGLIGVVTIAVLMANLDNRIEQRPDVRKETVTAFEQPASAKARTDKSDSSLKSLARGRREESAVAEPLSEITIDGDLSDWPAAIPRYPLLKLFSTPPNGYGGLQGADLLTSPDLSAAFSVGYDPKKQLIYLAVIVRDDKLIVGNTSHLDTDSVEVYIDGKCSDTSIPIPAGTWWENIDLSAVPVQQYVGIPGAGPVFGTKYNTNPVLLAGDLTKTRTRMAFRRNRDVTTYEWAIQAFDRYPDQPTKLEPGKRIGFDLAVSDKDVPAVSPQALDEPEADRAAWLYWGPKWTGVKTFDAGNLGELILAPPPGPERAGTKTGSPQTLNRQASPQPGSRAEAPIKADDADARDGIDAASKSTPRDPNEPSAVAEPLTGITIDGHFDDWPKRMKSYPIENLLIADGGVYSTRGHSVADLTASPDLSASFMAGYNPRDGLIYVAVTVRDDVLLAGHTSPFDTDAVELFVDATNTPRRSGNPEYDDWSSVKASEMAALQYVGVPGDGPAYGDPAKANPVLMYGRVQDRRTTMAYRRENNTTYYEWAIVPYDRYPGQQAQLVPGKRIGFDVAVVDKDSRSSPIAYVTWGPPATRFKGFDSGNLGVLVLGGDP